MAAFAGRVAELTGVWPAVDLDAGLPAVAKPQTWHRILYNDSAVPYDIWVQRQALWHRFESLFLRRRKAGRGVTELLFSGPLQLDEEGWYSVTPQCLAERMATLMVDLIVGRSDLPESSAADRGGGDDDDDEPDGGGSSSAAPAKRQRTDALSHERPDARPILADAAAAAATDASPTSQQQEQHGHEHDYGDEEGVVVVDAFCGCGGNAIALARHPGVRLVIAIDASRERLHMAASNARHHSLHVVGYDCDGPDTGSCRGLEGGTGSSRCTGHIVFVCGNALDVLASMAEPPQASGGSGVRGATQADAEVTAASGDSSVFRLPALLLSFSRRHGAAAAAGVSATGSASAAAASHAPTCAVAALRSAPTPGIPIVDCVIAISGAPHASEASSLTVCTSASSRITQPHHRPPTLWPLVCCNRPNSFGSAVGACRQGLPRGVAGQHSARRGVSAQARFAPRAMCRALEVVAT